MPCSHRDQSGHGSEGPPRLTRPLQGRMLDELRRHCSNVIFCESRTVSCIQPRCGQVSRQRWVLTPLRPSGVFLPPPEQGARASSSAEAGLSRRRAAGPVQTRNGKSAPVGAVVNAADSIRTAARKWMHSTQGDTPWKHVATLARSSEIAQLLATEAQGQRYVVDDRSPCATDQLAIRQIDA